MHASSLVLANTKAVDTLDPLPLSAFFSESMKATQVDFFSDTMGGERSKLFQPLSHSSTQSRLRQSHEQQAAGTEGVGAELHDLTGRDRAAELLLALLQGNEALLWDDAGDGEDGRDGEKQEAQEVPKNAGEYTTADCSEPPVERESAVGRTASFIIHPARTCTSNGTVTRSPPSSASAHPAVIDLLSTDDEHSDDIENHDIPRHPHFATNRGHSNHCGSQDDEGVHRKSPLDTSFLPYAGPTMKREGCPIADRSPEIQPRFLSSQTTAARVHEIAAQRSVSPEAARGVISAATQCHRTRDDDVRCRDWSCNEGHGSDNSARSRHPENTGDRHLGFLQRNMQPKRSSSSFFHGNLIDDEDDVPLVLHHHQHHSAHRPMEGPADNRRNDSDQYPLNNPVNDRVFINDDDYDEDDNNLSESSSSSTICTPVTPPIAIGMGSNKLQPGAPRVSCPQHRYDARHGSGREGRERGAPSIPRQEGESDFDYAVRISMHDYHINHNNNNDERNDGDRRAHQSMMTTSIELQSGDDGREGNHVSTSTNDLAEEEEGLGGWFRPRSALVAAGVPLAPSTLTREVGCSGSRKRRVCRQDRAGSDTGETGCLFNLPRRPDGSLYKSKWSTRKGRRTLRYAGKKYTGTAAHTMWQRITEAAASNPRAVNLKTRNKQGKSRKQLATSTPAAHSLLTSARVVGADTDDFDDDTSLFLLSQRRNQSLQHGTNTGIEQINLVDQGLFTAVNHDGTERRVRAATRSFPQSTNAQRSAYYSAALCETQYELGILPDEDGYRIV